MRLLLPLTAAATAAGPAPSTVPPADHLPELRRLFTPNDVPDYLLRMGEVDVTVHTRTTVRDDGSVQGCAIEQSSGVKGLDAYTCALILKRAKLAPAKWSDGTPAYAVLRFPITYRVTAMNSPPYGQSRSNIPDLDLLVNALPKSAHGAANLTLEAAADEAGRVLSCQELAAKNSRGPHLPELVPIACAQVQESLTLQPPVDRAGKPVRSIQSVNVRLTQDH